MSATGHVGIFGAPEPRELPDKLLCTESIRKQVLYGAGRGAKNSWETDRSTAKRGQGNGG